MRHVSYTCFNFLHVESAIAYTVNNFNNFTFCALSSFEMAARDAQPSTSSSAQASQESNMSEELSQEEESELYTEEELAGFNPKEKLQSVVIAEVRKHSCIYDKRKYVYRKLNTVKQAWMDITKAVVEKGFDLDGQYGSDLDLNRLLVDAQ